MILVVVVVGGGVTINNFYIEPVLKTSFHIIP